MLSLWISYDSAENQGRGRRSSKVNVCTLVCRSGCCTSASDSALFRALFSSLFLYNVQLIHIINLNIILLLFIIIYTTIDYDN